MTIVLEACTAGRFLMYLTVIRGNKCLAGGVGSRIYRQEVVGYTRLRTSPESLTIH